MQADKSLRLPGFALLAGRCLATTPAMAGEAEQAAGGGGLMGQLMRLQEQWSGFWERMQEIADAGGDIAAEDVQRLLELHGRAIQNFVNEVVSSFGLPLEDTRQQLMQTSDALATWKRLLTEGFIGQRRFNEVFGQLARQAEMELLMVLVTE